MKAIPKITIATIESISVNEKKYDLQYTTLSIDISKIYVDLDTTSLIFNLDKIGNDNVECISDGKDQYKRTLAECFVNNESLSSYLVRSGYAFAYRRYSKKFVADEDFARINKIGMWSMEFDYPWDYRKSKKN